MELERLFVVAYDIPDDGRRAKVANLLKSYGERVQLSVFECWLDGGELVALTHKLEKQVVTGTDSIRIYKPTADIQIIGVGSVTQRPSSWVA